MVLRWFKDAPRLALLARDAAISQATAYRYLHEAIDVLAAQTPDLHDVLTAATEEGWAFLALDGTLIETTRCAAASEAGYDLRYSG